MPQVNEISWKLWFLISSATLTLLIASTFLVPTLSDNQPFPITKPTFFLLI